jgi:hypothetical protein
MKRLQLATLIALVAASSLNVCLADGDKSKAPNSLEKNASNALHALGNEANKDGHAIASAVKGIDNKNSSAGVRESAQTHSENSWTQSFNAFGKGFRDAMSSLENWMKEVSGQGQSELVKVDREVKPYTAPKKTVSVNEVTK